MNNSETKTYRIWCEVNGIMGYREAWLKRNGEIYETVNIDEAHEEAFRLNSTMTTEPTTRFRYSTVEYGY
jgi:hypothetical protein